MTRSEITHLLKSEMLPALGCTGPTAYALATACCKPYLTAEPTEIKIYVSPAFLKIGFGVATPGTSMPGIEIAAAIGLLAGDWTLGLQVLKPCTQEDMDRAYQLVECKIIQVLCAWEKTGVYVRAEITTPNEQTLAVVEHTHDGVSLVQVNGETKFSAEVEEEAVAEEPAANLTPEAVFDYVEHAPIDELGFLLDGYRMNVELAEDGLKQAFGLGSGCAFLKEYWRERGIPEDLFQHPLDYLPDTLPERARVLVAGASDARMGGSRMPALAAMGDGNQGITATLPIGAAAELLGASEEETIRALTLSSLLLFYIKGHIGRAAAFCMCAIAASAGVAGGVGYLKGLNQAQICAAVKNVISPLAGMLCDGAKNGCALKMTIATSTALTAVNLAEDNVELGFFDGMVDDSLSDTVSCITGLACESMELLDKSMVDAILEKTARRRGQ